ncbi:MAG: RING finger protein [Oscillospiraceae bacterium]
MANNFSFCPECEKAFRPGDDIVFCPECGAPYHRDCYQNLGHCKFDDKHAAGFEYSEPGAPAPHAPQPQDPFSPNAGSAQVPPQAPFMGNNGSAQRPATCPTCGTINTPGTIFCVRCGTPLHGAPRAASSPFSFNNGPMGANFGAAPYPADATIDDIPLRDWNTYIGSSSSSYIPRLMQQQQRNSKTSFMFSAFVLGPFYYAYRRMWGWAALSFALWLIPSFASIIQIMIELNNPLVASFSPDTFAIIYNIITFLDLVLRSVSGIFALYLFRRSAGKKMKTLREKNPDDAQYYPALTAKSGPSAAGVLLVIAAVFIVSFALVPFVGSDISTYFLNTQFPV